MHLGPLVLWPKSCLHTTSQETMTSLWICLGPDPFHRSCLIWSSSLFPIPTCYLNTERWNARTAGNTDRNNTNCPPLNILACQLSSLISTFSKTNCQSVLENLHVFNDRLKYHIHRFPIGVPKASERWNSPISWISSTPLLSIIAVLIHSKWGYIKL